MRNAPRHAPPIRCITGALLLLPALGCVAGEGLLGEYSDTDVGTGTGEGSADESSGAAPGCEVDCDPNFAVALLSAHNYALQDVHLPGDATCVGPSCPEAVSLAGIGGGPVEPCATSAAALASPLGPEEHCRFAAGRLTGVVDVAFTTPVERSSFELVRARLDDETQTEPYLWYPDVVEVRGPGTSFRGRFEPGANGYEPARLIEVVNETCAARLTALGIPWAPGELEALCVGTWNDGGVLRPLAQEPSMVLTPYAGQLSTRHGSSCDTPESGPDTCCSACDLMLGPGVARYGVDAAGNRRNVNEGTAIACDPELDALVQCRDLVLDVERDPSAEYTYAWDGAPQAWPLPLYDKLRETHPDDRPAGLEPPGAACTTVNDCEAGQDCIGTDAAGQACSEGADCVARTCRPEWFGACQVTTTGGASCVDRRFAANGTGACLAAAVDFDDGDAGDRLSQCDANADGQLLASECCDPALGGGPGCDPFHQPGVTALARYDRHDDASPQASCACDEDQPASCAEIVDAWCEPPLGSASDPGPDSPAGDFAAPIVTRLGGVRWDETNLRLRMLLADLGSVPRAPVEACAEARGLVGERSPADGWLANAQYSPERLADHDLALCSGSTYELVFAESDAEHHVRSAAQGTLDGRSVHVVETSQFRVVPGSIVSVSAGDTLESCETVALSLSNRHDPSEANVRKLELHEGAPDGPLVAGGPGCDPLADTAAVAAGVIPCLTIDHGEPPGQLAFFVNEAIHGPVLQPGVTYFAVLPGLADVEQMADAEAYAAAFHDVCGMPLVVGDTPEELALWELGFTVVASCS